MYRDWLCTFLSALNGRLNLNLDKSGDETAECGDDHELIAIPLAFKRCNSSTVPKVNGTEH